MVSLHCNLITRYKLRGWEQWTGNVRHTVIGRLWDTTVNCWCDDHDKISVQWTQQNQMTKFLLAATTSRQKRIRNKNLIYSRQITNFSIVWLRLGARYVNEQIRWLDQSAMVEEDVTSCLVFACRNAPSWRSRSDDCTAPTAAQIDHSTSTWQASTNRENFTANVCAKIWASRTIWWDDK